MALADDVALRIPAAKLIQLTNPMGGAAPTSNDSTKLAQACSSIQTYFETYAEEEYDSTVGIHLEVCVKGVVGLLREWGSGNYTGSKEFWADFKEECDRVRGTRSRARMSPSTSSELTPSDEVPSGGTVRPWSDPAYLRGFVPRHVSSDDDDE